MLSLFKGELTLEDIMWHLPKKRLYELREMRKEALKEEQEELERMQAERNRSNIRNKILSP